MKLDEQVYAFYKNSIENKAFNPPVFDVAQMRAAADLTHNDRKEILPIWKSEDVWIPAAESGLDHDLRVRILTPHGGEKLSVLMYFHGGGFALHNVESHDSLTRKLAVTLGYAVVSVDYSLSPEHPYPVPVEEAEAVYRWIKASSESRSWNPDRIYAGGDSAGATICASLALRLADQKALRGMLLFYGSYWAADVPATESGKAFLGGDYVLPRELFDYSWEVYSGELSMEDPVLCPGKAEALECFPPCVVVHADCDPLRDDSLAFADKLERCGVTVKRVRAEGMMHGFVMYWYKFRKAEEIVLRACAALTEL